MILVIPLLSEGERLNPGGQATAARTLTKWLIKKKWSVRILNTVSPSFPRRSIWRKILEGTGRIGAASYLLTTWRPDGIVSFTGGGLGLIERAIICQLSKIFGVPTILFFRNSSILRMGKSKINTLFFKVLLSSVSVVCVQGSIFRRALIDIGVDQSKIIIVRSWLPASSPLNKNLPVPPKKNQIVRFLFVGWVVESKGIRELLNAIEILVAQRRKFEVTIVGGGTLESWVRERIAVSGWENVRALGWLSHLEVQRVFVQNDVLVLPSYAEGFPNVVLEAISAGLPVIVSDVGAVSDTITSGVNGYLIEPRSTDDLVAAMLRYINDPVLVRRHSQSALEAAGTLHNLESSMQKLINALYSARP